MTTYAIQIVVQTGGAIGAVNQLTGAMGGAHRAANILNRTLAGLGALGLARSVVKLADTYTVIQNRLRTVAPLQHQLARVTEETFQMAQRSRVGWEALANTYSRIQRATEGLRLRQSEVAEITDTLTKAIKLSGASTSETTSVLRQFGQALSKGKLDGDEFRSIMENSVEVGNLLTKSLGVTRGELMALSKAGKLTNAIIIKAFKEGRAEIVDRFGNAIPTVAERIEQLRNSAIKWAGTVASQSPVYQAFGAALGVVAKNFDTFATAALHLGEVLTVVLVARAIPAAIAAFNALTVAAAANPFLALAAGITLAVLAMNDLVKSYDEFTDAEKKRRAAIGPEDAFLRLSKDLPEFERNFISMDVARSLGEVNRKIREAIALGPSFSGMFDRWAQQLQGWGNGLRVIADTNVKVLTQVILGFTEATIKNTEAAVAAAEKWNALRKEFEGFYGQVNKNAEVVYQLRDAQDLLSRAVRANVVDVQTAQRAFELYRETIAGVNSVTGNFGFAMPGGINEGTGERLQGGRSFDPNASGNSQIAARSQELEALLDSDRQKVSLFLADFNAKMDKAVEKAEKASTKINDAFVIAFSNAEDALANFLATGEFSFHKFTESVLQDISRLLAKQLILAAVGLGSGNTSDPIAAGAALLGKGFASGGGFTVGGPAGVDNQVVAFRASRGERVTVATPGQQERAARPSSQPVVVQVIQHDDPRAIPAMLSTPFGARQLVETQRRYPSAPRALK